VYCVGRAARHRGIGAWQRREADTTYGFMYHVSQ
jgi:hypothetical protein